MLTFGFKFVKFVIERLSIGIKIFYFRPIIELLLWVLIVAVTLNITIKNGLNI